MKKISTNEYAEILFEITHDKSGKELEKALKVFTSYLSRNKSLGKFEEIKKSFVSLVDGKHGVVRGKIFTAQKLHRDELSEISKSLEKTFNAKEIILEEIEDDKLVAGWKIRTENYLIDGSVRGRIDKLGLVLTK